MGSRRDVGLPQHDGGRSVLQRRHRRLESLSRGWRPTGQRKLVRTERKPMAGGATVLGTIKAAYELMDEGYQKIRKGVLKNTDDIVFHDNVVDTTTWADYKQYAAEGHEIASHTVTHARLAVLDEDNLRYELEQSKVDIQNFLGEKYTFSAECPYGTENERVMEYANKIYRAKGFSRLVASIKLRIDDTVNNAAIDLPNQLVIALEASSRNSFENSAKCSRQ